MQLEGWRQHREEMANRTPAPRRYFIFAGLWALLFIGWTVMAIDHHSFPEAVPAVFYLAAAAGSLWSGRRDLRLLRTRGDGA